MDPTTSPTPTNTTDTENETPPATTAQLNNNKSLSFTNGALKKHHHHHPSQPPSVVVIYKECLKNHAAILGGHAVDGCGEFMPSPTANPTDPTSLKCAACGCHRNFHRREDDPTSNNTNNHFLEFHRHPPVPPRRSSPLSSPSPPPPPLQQHPSYYSSAPHMLLALSTAFPEDHQQTVNNHQHHPVATPATPKGENPCGRKRFRTKFSQEQKEKMLSFSEKLGWKMQRCDEGSVEEFCNEIGIGKGVLKVWMHNNKHTFSKRSSDMINSTTNGNIRRSLLKFDNNNNSSRHHHHNDQSNNDRHVSSNGSPSSA